MSQFQDTAHASLRIDADGVARVGQTRVPLDTVVFFFDAGASPEEIVQQFPVLNLADVYMVIGYYLHHRDEVSAYLEERQQQAQAVRDMIEARQNDVSMRARLLARRENQQ